MKNVNNSLCCLNCGHDINLSNKIDTLSFQAKNREFLLTGRIFPIRCSVKIKYITYYDPQFSLPKWIVSGYYECVSCHKQTYFSIVYTITGLLEDGAVWTENAYDELLLKDFKRKKKTLKRIPSLQFLWKEK